MKKLVQTICCSLLLSTLIKAEVDLIKGLTIYKNIVRVAIDEDFKNSFLRSDFFVEYEQDIDLEAMPYEIVTMPFIMNVISMVWISGKDYYIDSMDQELYESLNTIKKLFKKMYPTTSWEGNLIPRKTTPYDQKLKDLHASYPMKALLFSGGLDSTSSFFGHLDEPLLLVTAQGQYDLPLANDTLWQARKSKIQTFAQSYGKSCTFLRTNNSQFLKNYILKKLSPEIYSWRLCAVEGLGWAGLVAPLLFAKKCSTLYIASSYSYYYPVTACANPYIDNSIRFAGFKIQHDQYDLSRFQKIRFITDKCRKKQLPRPYLKVCQKKHDEDDNCCRCEKCLETAIGLIATNEAIADYGFNADTTTIVRKLVRTLKKGLKHHRLWDMGLVQKDMRNNIQPNDPRYTELAPFLSLDFSRLPIKVRRATLDCSALSALAPAGNIDYVADPLVRDFKI